LNRSTATHAQRVRDYAEAMNVSTAVFALCVLAGAGRAARAADCVDPDERAARSEANDTAITLCFDAGGCWELAIASHAWTRRPPLPPDTSPPRHRVDPRTTANIHVCAPDGTECHNIDLAGAVTISNLEAIQTPDRARVAIIGQGSAAYLYDGATRKLVATIRTWKSHYEADVIQEGFFVDGNLVLYESSSPITMEARLFDGATGKPLAMIASSILSDPIELSDGDWAFFDADISALVVVNARTGKRGKAITVVGPNVKDVTGASVFTYRTTDKKLFFAARGDAASGVVVYDLATKKQTRYVPPVCKK
jgi:hypothetical protein